MPAPRELSAVILARVAALPAAAQSFLAAASVLGQHAPVSAIVSVARLPDARNEVDAAVAAGLLTEDASALELAFAHPLYRAAIYADLSPASRRELHARAGEVVAGRARLAHRAAASLGPDEALAGELEASARAAAAAGDAGAAAWALEQAAALSLAAQDREGRLLDAAVVLLNAADTPAAARVLASCQVSSARRDALAGLLGVFTGSPGAEGSLLAAWQAHDPRTEGETGARAATSLANWMVLSGRPDQALTWADRAVSGTVPGSALRAMARTAQAYAFAAASRSPEGLAALGFLPVSGSEVPMPETDALIMRGMLKVYVDDLPGAIADLGVAAARLRTGRPSTYPGPCLAHLSDAYFRRGDWDAAVAHAQLATSLAQDTDRPLDLARAHARSAQVLAFRGQWPAAQAHVGAARAAAERFPMVLAVACAAMAGACLASARGDLAGVLAATEPVRATRLLDVGGCPGIFNWRAIEADALIGLGRLDDAETALSEFEDAIPAAGLASAALALARCRGNLAVARGPCRPGRSGVRARPGDRGASADAVRARPAEPGRRPPLARGREPAGGGRAARKGPPPLLRPGSRPVRAGLRHGTGSPAGHSRDRQSCCPSGAQPLRTGRGPAGRHRADQPGGGQPAVRVREDGGVPPPQQLHQARHHLPPGTSRSSGLTGPARRTTGRTAGDRAAAGSSAKYRVEPRVTPWGQCRAARVNCEPWTPHQRRGRRFAFSSISTGLRTDGSRDKYGADGTGTWKPFSGVLELLKVLEETYIDLH